MYPAVAGRAIVVVLRRRGLLALGQAPDGFLRPAVTPSAGHSGQGKRAGRRASCAGSAVLAGVFAPELARRCPTGMVAGVRGARGGGTAVYPFRHVPVTVGQGG